jgi:hypothetical protein
MNNEKNAAKSEKTTSSVPKLRLSRETVRTLVVRTDVRTGRQAASCEGCCSEHTMAPR